MSFILKRIEIGQVGDLPGQLLMSSDDDLVTITAPGYLSASDGVLPTDIITAVYGNPLVLKQTFNPTFGANGVITLVVIGGGGSINGAVNLGAGDGLLGVAGSNITGKSLIAGANISLTPTATDITIAAIGSGGGTITDIVDVGIGQGHLAAGASGANVQVKTLVEGSNIVITEDSNTVTIAATNSSTGLTTLANLPGGEGIYTTTVGTVAQLKSIAAGAGIDISSTPDTIVITNVGGGGGGNFEYQNAQWVAQNGNDANDGRSINTPKLNVQAAITALGASGIIHIEDDGAYTGNWTIPSGFNITINAPAAFLNTTGVTLVGGGAILKINSYSFGTNFNNIISSSNCSVFINAEKVRGNFGDGATNPTQLFIYAQEITGNFVFASNLSAIISFETLSGNITDTSPAITPPTIGVFGRNITGNITSTNSKIYGNLVSTSPDAVITGIGFGNFANLIDKIAGGFSDAVFIGGDLTVQSQSVRTAVAGCLNNWALARGGELLNGYIFRMEDSGKLFTYTGNTDITVYGPSDATVPWLPAGWFVTIQQANANGRVIVAGDPTGDGANIYSTGGNRTQGQGASIVLNLIRGQNNASTREYGLSGSLSTSSASVVNIFISQILGNNATANGTLQSQFATINAALAYVIATYTATPSHGINLFITDDAIYNEKLDFTGTSNIQLLGRTAQIIYASSGGGDNGFTSDSPEQFVSVAALATTGGGDSVDYSGTGALILNVDVLGSGAGATNNNGTGFLIAQAYVLEGATTNTGGGQFRYSTIQRSGTDGAGVIGNAADGASQDWTVLRNLRAPANLFVQSTPVAVNVAAIPITAAILADRIMVNNDAGPSTWTLDTAANLNAAYPGIQSNDAFSVFVSNLAGSTITFANSAGTTVTGNPTSASSFTFWMRYVGGLWELYY